MSTRRPPHVVRPRRLTLFPSITVRVGRNHHGHSATVVGHEGVWAAHETSVLTAVLHAAWRVWFKPQAIKRGVWELYAASKVEQVAENRFTVSIEDTNAASVRQYSL